MIVIKVYLIPTSLLALVQNACMLKHVNACNVCAPETISNEPLMSSLRVRTIYCADTNGPFTETHFPKDCLPYDKTGNRKGDREGQRQWLLACLFSEAGQRHPRAACLPEAFLQC